jgi:hypothetical protein
MQGLPFASGKFPRSTSSSNPELRAQVTDLVGRAYFNIHGVNIASAEASWTATIITACMQLCLEESARELSARELVHLFQNVIRVSNEHQRESKRHAAMALNVFYLKATALDSSLYEQSLGENYRRATPTVVGGFHVALSGRISRAPIESDDVA